MNEYFDPNGNGTASFRGGHFPGLLLPPILVILIGLLISLISSGMVINQSVIAGSGDELTRNSDPIIDQKSVSNLAKVFTPEIQYWSDEIERWSSSTGLDMNMIATVMQIESCGDPGATSGAGAMGLFQVMPFHFQANEDPYAPEINALRGLAYLASSLKASNGDVRLAFAGYNGGISVINQSEDTWASETQRYAYWASGVYTEATQGVETSDRLIEWLGSGGTSLCLQAANHLGLVP